MLCVRFTASKDGLHTAMSEQLPLITGDALQVSAGLITGPENEIAIKWLKNWPDWPPPSRFLNIFGPKACGKSCLGEFHQKRTGAQLFTRLDSWEPSKLTGSHFILDDIILSKNWSEEALFFLYQNVTGNSGTILFLSEKPISSIAWQLHDLRSRFRSVNAQEILPLREASLRPLLQHHFTQRQCVISQTVLNFLVPRVQREYSYVQKIVNEIDKLSLNSKKAVSIGLVKQVLSEISGDSL